MHFHDILTRSPRGPQGSPGAGAGGGGGGAPRRISCPSQHPPHHAQGPNIPFGFPLTPIFLVDFGGAGGSHWIRVKILCKMPLVLRP